MYDVTIEHPGMDDRQYVCDGPGELRNLVWGVARAQGKPITDKDGRDREMILTVGDLRSRADVEGVGTLMVEAVTVRVEPADESAYACEGHEGEDAVLRGGPLHCDGRCKPRRRFDRQALVDLSLALDDADLEASGGCGRCGLEAEQMCADCRRCNCHRHDSCKRPAGK
ncbi:hypothetical protein AB0N14_17700 [Streptomyces sp. NPDC051104]|uniref:hypothetical protein n=1 Tax=Streptomyces sp. NPDC051104 TaxID=3155044 RepID=UPI0034283D1E